ncbi:MAG: hypothetical protein ACI3XA_01930 [Clostridia bacterium]
MTELNCQCPDCTTHSVILSTILGVIAAFLSITCILRLTAPIIFTALIVALLYLPVVLIALSLRTCSATRCVCRALKAIIIGVLGTVITSLILLTIPCFPIGVIYAIIVGLLTLFFFLMLSSTGCLIRCISNCPD